MTVPLIRANVDRVGFELGEVRANAEEIMRSMEDYVDPMSRGGLGRLFGGARPTASTRTSA